MPVILTGRDLTLDEVTRVLKITDGAMRHMAVRRPAAQPRRTEAVQPAG